MMTTTADRGVSPITVLLKTIERAAHIMRVSEQSEMWICSTALPYGPSAEEGWEVLWK